MPVCCAAAGCAVGIGVYGIIAGAVAAVTTIVIVALKVLSNLPAFSKNEKLKERIQTIQDSCIHFRQKVWDSLKQFFEKLRSLLSPSGSCCHANKANA